MVQDNTLNLRPMQRYQAYNKIREGRKCGDVGIYINDTIPCTYKILSALWLTAQPRWLPREISVLVICGIYFPARAPAGDTLREHIIDNVFSLQAKYKNPFFVILGTLTLFLTVKSLPY